jgi:OmpA-OmpF porin, OOP family
MKKILMTVAIVMGCSSLHAQFTYDYLKAADNYFQKNDFYSAAQYYEKYLGVNGNDKSPGYNPYVVQTSSKKSTAPATTKEQAIYKLAVSYHKLNYHVKAEPAFEAALNLDKTQFPLVRYQYAVTLRALGKFAEAEAAFQQFLAEYGGSDLNTEAAKKEILNLKFIQSELNKRDLNLYKVDKVSSEINAGGANYAPVWLDASTLVFTSTRPEGTGDNTDHTNRLYQVTMSEGVPAGLTTVSIPTEKNIHQGVATFSPDGNTMFLTKWTSEGDGKKNSSVYRSTRSGSSWTNPELVAGLNQSGSSSMQPCVMPDGKHIIFSSDRAGGQGAFDLWMGDMNTDGSVSNIVNLGNSINTAFDEQAPSYHAASSTLVFSTNGRVGMGGFDIFYTTSKMGNWSDPVNFGYPVNSVKDDLYFTSRGNAKNILADVLLSSDRNADCCLETYTLKKDRPLRQISGIVTDCETNQPLTGATVNIVDISTNGTVTSITTSADGSYSFTLEDFRPLKAFAANAGYHPNSLEFNGPSDEESIVLSNPAICLRKIPEVGQTEVMENIYYEFDKAVLLDESFSSLDKLADMLNANPTVRIEIGGHTDSKGNDDYNQKLSEARAKSVVDYLIGKGIDASRLTAVGYGEKFPVAPNTNDDGSDNPEGRQKNRRTEFKVLSK